MLRVLKWIGIVLGALLLAVVGWYFLLFDWNDLRDHLAGLAQERTGRELTIEGDMDVELGWVTRVRLEGVRVANAEWSEHPDMARIEVLDFTIQLRELLRGRIVLPEVTLERPHIRLERNAQGESNWELVTHPAVDVAVPEEREDIPIFGRLIVADGVLVYNDMQRDIDVESAVSTAIGLHEPAQERVHLDGAGSFEGMAFAFAATGGSLLMLREEDDPYPVRIEAQIGETALLVEGTVLDPVQALGLDLRMELQGEDLAEVFPIFGIPFPPTRPYHIAGQLWREGPRWRFTDFTGQVGRSDLSGDLAVDLAQTPPYMRAAFVSRRLEMSELAGFLGVRPTEVDPEPEAEGPAERLIPATPINLERLRAMNMEVTFHGDHLIAARIPAQRVAYRLVLEQGRLSFEPLTFGIADGRISGRIVLDGSEDVPALEAGLDLHRLQLARFIPEIEAIDIAEGIFGGRVELAGRGRTLAEILGASDGGVWLAMSGGAIDRFVVAAIGLDVAEMLTLLGTEEPPMPLRCSVGAFRVEQGIAHAEVLVFDAEESTIVGEGHIDLGEERLALTLEAQPKEPSPLVLGGDIEVQGTFREPDIGIDLAETVVRVGVAAAIAAVLPPLAAVLPFLEPGLGEDTDCDALFVQAGEVVTEPAAPGAVPDPPPQTEGDAQAPAEEESAEDAQDTEEDDTPDRPERPLRHHLP
jgi:AsmA family protein